MLAGISSKAFGGINDVQPGEPLFELAARSNLYFGSAARIEDISREADLRSAILRECAMVTPELALKWDAVERSPGAFDFASMDNLLAFAFAHGKQIRGHTLLWHGSVPQWGETLLRKDSDWAFVRRYFETTISRYRTVIDQWDVINEPIETGFRMDGLRANVFLRAFGPNYISRALRDAHSLAPNAQLMINEFGLEYDIQIERDRRYHFLKLLERLKNAGVPLHGVGLQAHLDLSKGRLPETLLSQFLQEIANFGLFIVVTELDVKEFEYTLPVEQRDRRVADETKRYLDVVLAQPAVRGLITWGLSDRHTWLNVTPLDFARYPNAWKDGSGPGRNRGLPFDSSMTPKPMYWAIADALRHRQGQRQ